MTIMAISKLARLLNYPLERLPLDFSYFIEINKIKSQAYWRHNPPFQLNSTRVAGNWIKSQSPALQKTDIFTIQRNIFFVLLFTKSLRKADKKKKFKPRLFLFGHSGQPAKLEQRGGGRVFFLVRQLPEQAAGSEAVRAVNLGGRRRLREKKKKKNQAAVSLKRTGTQPTCRHSESGSPSGWGGNFPKVKKQQKKQNKDGDALWARPEPRVSHHHSNRSDTEHHPTQ